MTTTLRIADTDKARLERVQRRLNDLTGQKLTLQRILGLMVRHAEAEPRHIIDLDDTPPTPTQVDWLLGLQGDFGDADASDVDDIVYGPRG